MAAPTDNLLIFGASTRAAAFSALRAGLRPWCADLFGDADLVSRCPTIRMPAGDYPHGIAFRFDNGNIRIFYRFGRTRWFEGTYKNDGTYTTLRYTGVAMYSGGAQYIGPVSIWYDT